MGTAGSLPPVCGLAKRGTTAHAYSGQCFRIAVSARRLLEVIRAALDEAQLDPRFLEIELTESAVMTDPEDSAATLEQLSRMGVLVSVDDFGTGYSSMSYLRRFPIDKLKIDRSFVKDLMSRQMTGRLCRRSSLWPTVFGSRSSPKAWKRPSSCNF